MGFKFKVSENKFAALDEKQWYPVRLLGVEEDTMEWEGKAVAKFKFSFAVLFPDEFEGRELNGMVNQPTGGELNERHTLFAWLTALRGGVPPIVGDEIDFPDQFLGKVVLAQVKSTKKTYQGREMVFQNVSKLAVCVNAQDYAERAPDKQPGCASEAQSKSAPAQAAKPSAPPAKPQAPPPTAVPSNPKPAEAPAAPKQESGNAPSISTGASGKSTIKVDGEEIELPF